MNPAEIETKLGLARGDILELTENLHGKVLSYKTKEGLSSDKLLAIKRFILGKVENDSVFISDIAPGILGQGLNALNNWVNLTDAQKDTVLKKLLKYVLWKEGMI